MNVRIRAIAWAAVSAGLALAAPLASAGTIRHDVTDATYTAFGNQAQFVSSGLLSANGDVRGGTLIRTNLTDPTSRFVLTAAHNVAGLTPAQVTFTVGGNTYTADQITIHPSYGGAAASSNDIAVVRLATAPPNVTPANIYTGTSELTATGSIVGFGATGTGVTGTMFGTQGTKRGGTNVIDVFGAPAAGGGLTLSSADGADRIFLVADFDDARVPPLTANVTGSATPLATEYQVADKDSGSSLFITEGGTMYLAGVGDFVADPNNTTGTSSNVSTYGDLSGWVRVSKYNSFIASAVPEPSGLALLAAGAGLLLRRRRRA